MSRGGNVSMKRSLMMFLCGILLTSSLTFLSREKLVNLMYKEDLGAEVVRNLYQFDEIEDLVLQDKALKELTSEESYKELTATNADRALNTYLKFNKKPVKVIILDSVRNYLGGTVTYSLDSVSISNGRIFTFSYKLKDGKVCDVEEYECINLKKNENVITTPLEEEVGD